MKRMDGLFAAGEVTAGEAGNRIGAKESTVNEDGRTHNTTRIEVSKAALNRELSHEAYVDKIEDGLLREIVKGMTMDKKQKLFAALEEIAGPEEKRFPFLEAQIANEENLFAWVNYYANETDAEKNAEALATITEYLQSVNVDDDAYQEAA